MTMPASVEKLKADWLRDPCYDLATVEGFDGYREHLAAFAIEQRERWAHEAAELAQRETESQSAYWLKELVAEMRTLNDHLASIDRKVYNLWRAVENTGGYR